jgi:hypothetical protein
MLKKGTTNIFFKNIAPTNWAHLLEIEDTYATPTLDPDTKHIYEIKINKKIKKPIK